MELYQIIQRPLITEKAMKEQGTANCYSFAVDMRSDKGTIKAAIEQLFKVHVEKINTAIVRGKVKRIGRSEGKRPNWKKAVVTLRAGEKIELVEGA